LLQAPRIDPDPHRDALVAGLADDLLEPLLAADVAGVDPDLVDGRAAVVGGRVEAGQGHPVVVVDVGDQRECDPRADVPAGLDVFLLRHRDADDLAAGLFEPPDLGDGLGGVERVGGRHRLDPDRVVATDDPVADPDLARLVPVHHRAIGHCEPPQVVGNLRFSYRPTDTPSCPYRSTGAKEGQARPAPAEAPVSMPRPRPPGWLKRLLLPAWNGGHRLAWRAGEYLGAIRHGRFGRCDVCGRFGPWLYRRRVIPPKLEQLWGLTPRLAEALARKESMDCAW